MAEIKPIETYYNGFKFRSKLEARWAVAFDVMGYKYEYEPEGFDCGDGVYYLPDFYLPDHGVWVEIKGKPLSDEEQMKINKFCEAKCDITNGGERFRLLMGQIPLPMCLDGKPTSAIQCLVYLSAAEIMKAFKADDMEPYVGELVTSIWLADCPGEKVAEALQTARQARFDHGQTPIIKRRAQ